MIPAQTSSPSTARNLTNSTATIQESMTETSIPPSSLWVTRCLRSSRGQPDDQFLNQLGWSVLSSQFSLHHRCPIQVGTRSERHDRFLHENPHSRRKRFALHRRGPRFSHLDRPPSRDRHYPVFTLREFDHVTLCRIPRNAREAVGRLVSPQPWRFCCRQEPGKTAEVGRAGELVLPHRD